MKVDKLEQHYAETKNANASISFFDFLVMHYLTDDNNSSDDAQDKQLPFKSANLFMSSPVITAAQVAFDASIAAGYFVDKTTFVKKEFFCLASYTCRIWLPPKLS